MATSPPCLGDVADVMPRADGGFYVVPFLLPIDVPKEALGLTVAEWLAVAAPTG
ncbi:hypothetical protein OIE13_22485 [Streptosporangium sp. NBC_01810]|uniref:hypothetical protein n=1 Tax=Streptosporangium sp. NBC_01810 TaxID=2975951 RepID=UPI002DDC8262|nr:hypothetical protein [Streptosporangium sp. NBC_01810]WSA23712.1 hypothetical protein OIE13_22485 [Streptosporangium sp. NBC_01810]